MARERLVISVRGRAQMLIHRYMTNSISGVAIVPRKDLEGIVKRDLDKDYIESLKDTLRKLNYKLRPSGDDFELINLREYDSV